MRGYIVKRILQSERSLMNFTSWTWLIDAALETCSKRQAHRGKSDSMD
jgi:hypothetical protein